MQDWSVYVELAARDVDEDAVDALHEALTETGHHPSVGEAPSGDLSVQLSVSASNARGAIDAALRAVETAARDLSLPGSVVGIELLTDRELQRRLDEPAVPRLAGVTEAAAIIGVGKQRVTQLAKQPGFPRPVQTLAAGPVFLDQAIRVYAANRVTTGGRRRAAIHLTDVERALLRAIATGSPPAPPAPDLDGVRVEVMTKPGRVRVEGLDAGTPAEALATLLRHRLVRRPVQVRDQDGVELELTPKGEQAAS